MNPDPEMPHFGSCKGKALRTRGYHGWIQHSPDEPLEEKLCACCRFECSTCATWSRRMLRSAWLNPPRKAPPGTSGHTAPQASGGFKALPGSRGFKPPPPKRSLFFSGAIFVSLVVKYHKCLLKDDCRRWTYATWSALKLKPGKLQPEFIVLSFFGFFIFSNVKPCRFQCGIAARCLCDDRSWAKCHLMFILKEIVFL